MSKLPKRFVLLRLLGLAVFALLATIAPRLAVAESSDIPMAVVGPMTGDWAVYGEEMRRGAQLAADDINGEGGIGGRKITLTFLDDEGRPDGDCREFCARGHDDGKERIIAWLLRRNFWT
ncbi:ABC transporter substrate-binding protein, partial [Mesorhizobium sp. M1300]|uniref:ABC transporter substrate-binding protein n=1 Tax=Mesorhizobium sp. M1300 TaxID=2957077 RepID=UPI00333CD598